MNYHSMTNLSADGSGLGNYKEVSPGGKTYLQLDRGSSK
jgi:hypothetical protein